MWSTIAIGGAVLCALLLGASFAVHHDAGAAHELPAMWLLGCLPFLALLLCIAALPLVPATHLWWESNLSKFAVAMVCAGATLGYLALTSEHARLAAPAFAVKHALLDEFIPFIILLGSLFAVAGGIHIQGDLPARPSTNTAILALGTVAANLIGTTGASMLLIRFLLKVNSERRRQVHTVIFFIFLVSNIGGSLLPIGDPPLYLGYLKGVPFLWTLTLWVPWLAAAVTLLAVYWIWDSIEYKRESAKDIKRDDRLKQPLRISGLRNVPLLLGIVVGAALLDPSRPIPGLAITPPPFAREGVLIGLSILSLLITPKAVREGNEFSWFPILEVAALFSGIFIAMQVPLAVLHAKGAALGIDSPIGFFWTTGILSSVLDNAPTYLVFLQTAQTLPLPDGATVVSLGDGAVRADLLTAISIGAVFMGANTYIGNGPNFMVKAIAERSGVAMPSFVGYVGYSAAILIPLFIAVGFVFFR